MNILRHSPRVDDEVHQDDAHELILSRLFRKRWLNLVSQHWRGHVTAELPDGDTAILLRDTLRLGCNPDDRGSVGIARCTLRLRRIHDLEVHLYIQLHGYRLAILQCRLES